MEIKPEWHQDLVIYCPDMGCKGMLLQSDFYHEMKCSKCGKLWMDKIEWMEVDKLNIQANGDRKCMIVRRKGMSLGKDLMKKL